MAAVHRGFGASIGIGVESVYGTPVARTNWLRGTTVSGRRTLDKPLVPHLGDLSQVSTMMRNFYTASDNASGTISYPLAYDDSSVLLARHTFGTNADGGAGPFTHTMTLSSPLPGPLTVEQISGTPATGNMTEVFTSCLINTTRYIFEVGKIAMVEHDFIAQTSGGLVAAGTPSQNVTREYVQHQQAGTSFSVFGSVLAVRKFTIAINRNLQRNQELGALTTQIPIEGGLEIEMEAQVLWQSATWYTNYLNSTQGNLQLTFTGTSSRSLAITSQNVLVVDRSAPVNTAGGILETIKLRPHADASNQGLSMVFTNGNAVHTSN
jgi:hypothetical protein